MFLTPMKSLLTGIPRKKFLSWCNKPKDERAGFELWNDFELIVEKDDPGCLNVSAHNRQTITESGWLFHAPQIFGFETATVRLTKLNEKPHHPIIQFYRTGNASRQREFINYKRSTFSSFLEASFNKTK